MFSKEDTLNIPKVSEKLNYECPNPTFTEEVIKLYMDKLDGNNAIGVDKVHPKVLKMFSNSLCVLLSLILNESYVSGIVPDLWCKANTVPLFKKGC